MKTKDIIQYEKANINTILLHTNKSVCRVYEVSAYWLSSHTPVDKFHRKHCRGHNTHLLYVWFHASKLGQILKNLHSQGFRAVSTQNDHIILQNDSRQTENYHGWREKIIGELEAVIPESEGNQLVS